MFQYLRESGETVLGGAIAGVVATAITQSNSDQPATFLALAGVVMLLAYKKWMEMVDNRYSEEDDGEEYDLAGNPNRTREKRKYWKYN